MKLKELLAKVTDLSQFKPHPALEKDVLGLATNSHACQTGDLFIGMPGTRVDGGDFWPGAIANGAVAALVSESAAKKTPPARSENPELPCVIAVPNMTASCAQVAAAFYGYPAQQLQLVGVTGTNGKTTTTHLIEYLLELAEKPTALFGTLYTRWLGSQVSAAYTTPFAVELHQKLAEAVKAGCRYGVMEVSSHALHQGRVLECPFEVAVFTNLTQDHLDYHPTMEDYFEAKALLFTPQYLKGRAIINADDPYGKRLIERLETHQVWSYSINDSKADLWADQLCYQPNGVKGVLHTPQGEAAFELPLVGQYNLSNLLAAVGAGIIGSDHHHIRQICGNFSHFRAFGAIAISPAAKYTNHSPRNKRTGSF